MAGTKEGGKKSAATVKKWYGQDHHAKIGSKGGKRSRTGGFYNNPELASRAGRIGGKLGKRGKARG